MRCSLQMFSGAVALLGVAGCSASTTSAPPLHVAAAPPPKDDGKPAEGGTGGNDHSAALEELKISGMGPRTDKLNAIRVVLPDSTRWTRVRFWGVPSTVGFRYGKDHHAIVAGFVTHVPDNTVQGACMKSFEDWATPWIEMFDADITHEQPQAFSWKGSIVEVDVLTVKSATLASQETYAAAYGAYPAWKGACLIVGIAVPARDDEPRAREVRDRFAKEALPQVDILSNDEPNEQN